MGAGRTGGVGPTAAALAATVAVAVAVLAIVLIGGGADHPLVMAPQHLTAAHSLVRQG